MHSKIFFLWTRQKGTKFSQDWEVEFKKPFELYHQISLRASTEVALNLFQKWAKWNNLFHQYSHQFYQLGMISSACFHSEKGTLVVSFHIVTPLLNIGLFFPYRQQRINLKTPTQMFMFTKLLTIIIWVWAISQSVWHFLCYMSWCFRTSALRIIIKYCRNFMNTAPASKKKRLQPGND